jgi:hypothetical protein
MMDQSNIGSGATVAELMQMASTALKLTEKTGRLRVAPARSASKRSRFPGDQPHL